MARGASMCDHYSHLQAVRGGDRLIEIERIKTMPERRYEKQ